MPKPFRAVLSSAALAAGTLPAAAQDSLPGVLAAGETSDFPIAVQRLRWSMNDADVNALTFRSMDKLFTTRTVP